MIEVEKMFKDFLIRTIKRSSFVSGITTNISIFLRNQRYNKIKKPILKEINIGEHNFKILLNPRNDFMEELIYNNNKFEPQVSDLIKKYSDKNNFFIDVGSNVGYHSLYASSLFKKVIAFEPVPEVFRQFKKSINLNGFNNVFAYNLACSSKNGKSYIRFKKGAHGGAALRKYKTSDCTRITTVSLDSFLKKYDHKISLIKIDVEGHEFHVVKGMKKIIKKHKPRIIMEFIPDILNKTKPNQDASLLNYLSEYYKFIDIEKKYPIKDLKSYIFHKRKENCFSKPSNLLLVPKK